MDDRSNRKRRLTDDVSPPFTSSSSAGAGGPAANGSPAPITSATNTKRQFTGSGSGSTSPLITGKEDTETMTAAEVRIGVALGIHIAVTWVIRLILVVLWFRKVKDMALNKVCFSIMPMVGI